MASRKGVKPTPAQRFTAALEALPFVTRRKSRYGHREAFYVDRAEIAHFHSPSVIDLKLGWRAIKKLKDDGQDGGDDAPGLMFRDGRSDWLEIDLSAIDAKRAGALARSAYENAMVKRG